MVRIAEGWAKMVLVMMPAQRILSGYARLRKFSDWNRFVESRAERLNRGNA